MRELEDTMGLAEALRAAGLEAKYAQRFEADDNLLITLVRFARAIAIHLQEPGGAIRLMRRHGIRAEEARAAVRAVAARGRPFILSDIAQELGVRRTSIQESSMEALEAARDEAKKYHNSRMREPRERIGRKGRSSSVADQPTTAQKSREQSNAA